MLAILNGDDIEIGGGQQSFKATLTAGKPIDVAVPAGVKVPEGVKVTNDKENPAFVQTNPKLPVHVANAEAPLHRISVQAQLTGDLK